MKRMRRLLVSFVATGVLAVGLVAVTAGPASADYGQGALYQVELSANTGGPQGGGIWLWIELTPSGGSTTSGTGDYQGADCGHGIGAARDSGDVTWSVSGDTLTIAGVVLNALLGTHTTITVPSAYGHTVQTNATTFSGLPLFVPPNDRVQVTVAP